MSRDWELRLVVALAVVSPTGLPQAVDAQEARWDSAWSSPDGRFRFSAVRMAQSEGLWGLLDRAEAIMPSTELVRAAFDSLAAELPGVAERQRRVNSVGGSRWWLDEIDGTHSPYAVTDSAVAYYMRRVPELAEYWSSREPRQSPRGGEEASVSLTYEGVVSERPLYEVDGRSFGEVAVAELVLQWESWCGFLCGMGFTHKRTVVFDRSGEVLAVFGDGPPAVWVS